MEWEKAPLSMKMWARYSTISLPEYIIDNIVVILAGYEKEMHEMLELNQCLKFDDLSPLPSALPLLKKQLLSAEAAGYSFSDNSSCIDYNSQFILGIA